MVIQRLIILYFLLLIFEGALRKWFLPGLATPLLVVRDPVVLLIYLVALRQGLFPINSWVGGAVLLSVVASLLTLTVGHGNPIVLAYGLRANFLQIPLIFVIGQAMDRRTLGFIVSGLLWLSIPMTILIAVQYFSPPEAQVNIGVGGEGTASFDGVGGRNRPSGTFSFITGVSAFYTFAFAAWLTALFDKRLASPMLLAVSGVAILGAIPLSISRMLLISVALVALGSAAVFIRLPGWSRTVPRLIFVVGFSGLMTSQLPFFDEAVNIMELRINEASRIEGGNTGFIQRVWMDLSGPFMHREFNPTGAGLGAGTQGGAQLLHGERGFYGGEGEWWRLLYELGTVLGTFFIIMRFWLTVKLGLCGWRMLATANPLPWLFFFACGFLVLNGQWGQPTALGFAILGAGIIIAGARLGLPDEDETNTAQ
ncbi:MAG: hypothetical protein GVY36_06115 [Verrucomicrobia bacterium]|jgi:hypothetical protein|nr:hypothetical protein [Verrucomicrobiota bacterium]